MDAAERFKALFANTVERVCVLEAQLELAQAEIERLNKELEKGEQNGNVSEEAVQKFRLTLLHHM